MADLVVDLGRAQEVADQCAALVPGERLERDARRVRRAATPRRPDVEQIRTRHAAEQDRHAPRPSGDVVDEVQERGLPPVDIVEDQEERHVLRDRLDEVTDRPERLLRRSHLTDAEELRHATADELLMLLPFEDRADLRLDGFGGVEVREIRPPPSRPR